MSTIYLEGLLTDIQLEAVDMLVKSGRGIVWHKVGEGKTRIAIEWALQITNGKPNPLIVCSPQSFRQWQDELVLVGKGNIFPCFYSSGMLSTKKGAELLSRMLARDEDDLLNCMIVDELWMYKNVQTNRSRVLRQLTSKYPTIGLSGSMMTARNIEDLYGQVTAVSLDKLVAKGLTDFRRQYTIEVQNHMGYIDRYPRKDALENIQTKLKGYVHLYFPKDVREIRNITINIDPTPEQKNTRKKLLKYYYEQNGFEINIQNAAVLLNKLQQVSDGFLYGTEGSYLSIPSNKARKLSQLCSELLSSGERVLVWFAFKQSIQEALEVSTYPTEILSSNDKFDFEAWAKGQANVCYATVGSGSSLNDFKDVGYSIIYSSNYSHRAIQQAKGRTNRKGSKQECCYYYYLQTLTFPDKDIYGMLADSKEAEDYIIKATKELLDDFKASKNNTFVMDTKVYELVKSAIQNFPITQSEMMTRANCPRKWFYRYAMGLKRRGGYNWHFLYGDLIHRLLAILYEKRWQGSLSTEHPIKTPEINFPDDALPTQEDREQADMLRKVARITFKNYRLNYQELDSKMQVMDVENVIEVQYRGLEFAGKIDLVARPSHRDGIFVWDYKTTGMFNSSMLDAWSFRFQFLFYCWLYWQSTGDRPSGNYVNGILKTLLRPKKGESKDEYIDRINDDMRGNRGKYFYRVRMPLSDGMLERFQEEILDPHIDHFLIMMEEQSKVSLTMNTDHCHLYGSFCEYLPLCKDGKINLPEYSIRETKHEELV